jgi:hypothetical protein
LQYREEETGTREAGSAGQKGRRERQEGSQGSITSAKPEVVIELKHDAKLSGDKMTVLVGTHEVLAKKADLKGNIKGNVDGKPFSGDFEYEAKK